MLTYNQGKCYNVSVREKEWGMPWQLDIKDIKLYFWLFAICNLPFFALPVSDYSVCFCLVYQILGKVWNILSLRKLKYVVVADVRHHSHVLQCNVWRVPVSHSDRAYFYSQCSTVKHSGDSLALATQCNMEVQRSAYGNDILFCGLISNEVFSEVFACWFSTHRHCRQSWFMSGQYCVDHCVHVCCLTAANNGWNGWWSGKPRYWYASCSVHTQVT